jgi:uncharacterized protein YdhG (YjbR/CyaY superfamily)
MGGTFESVDSYITSFPDEVQGALQGARRRIHATAPGLGETITYDIPTFTLDGRYLVYLAGWKRHISIYPVTDVDPALERDIAPFRAAKGTLRFPLNRPVPYELIERVVRDLLARRFG